MKKIIDIIKHLLNKKSKNEMMNYHNKQNRDFIRDPVFFIGTGRSGTHFFADLFGRHDDIVSYHTDKHDKHDLDSFSRFIKWFELPISTKNVIDYRGFYIEKANEKNKMYIEANAYLSFMIQEFYENFNAKLILTTRDPKKVVNSLDNKGWYKNVKNYDVISPFPDYNFLKLNHSFGRISPKTADELILWKNYSSIGKNAWFWNSYHKFIFELFENLPSTHKKIIKIEEFDFEEYKNICKFIGTKIQLSQNNFEKIVNNRPEKSKKIRGVNEWVEQEKKEFNELTALTRNKLGYHEIK